MNIYIINESSVLEDDELKAAIPALIVYTRHIRNWWGSMQPGIIFGEPLVSEAWKIIVADDSDQAGALGYHDFTPGGRPISYVFAKTDLDYGYNWQVTLTHELAEMLLDPYVMRCEQTGNARFHALELCDPVEADALAYPISAGGYVLSASDFLTPMWFVPNAPAGIKYDHRGYCAKPLEILDGGYAYYWLNGKWVAEDNFGKQLTPEELARVAPTKTRLKMYARDRGENGL
jgi:hypothetical protein